jgi:hypothetical protein
MPLPYDNDAQGLASLACGRSFLISHAFLKHRQIFSHIHYGKLKGQ